uniref:Peptidase C2 calpain domain-containing protein n=1 Tax=Acrobeloides nanus TaxID=290746 RepID=A0A914DA61_9BILA
MTEVRAPHKPWDMVVFEGAWIKGSTAGGCRNYLETFPMNPQYPLNLKADGTSTMIVALMQKYRRELRNEGLDNLAIGFTIYQVSSKKVDFENEEPINTKSNFINLREVTGRFETIAGEYIILPSTFKPNEEAEFMLRIFSNGSISSYNETNINQPFSQLNLSNSAFSNNSMTPQYSGPHYERQQPSAPYQPYYQSQPNPSANPYRPNTNVPYNYGYGGSNFQNIPRQPYSIPSTGYNPNTAYAQQQNMYRPYVPNTRT